MRQVVNPLETEENQKTGTFADKYWDRSIREPNGNLERPGMKTRDLFLRILTVVAGMEILVIIILGSTGMKESMGKNLIDAFLLPLLSVPLISLLVVKRETRRLSEQAVLSGRILEKEREWS